MSNKFHEVAMLAAQVWGECNGAGADPEQFGADVAVAYTAGFSAMKSENEFAELPAQFSVDSLAEASAHEVMRGIITKQAR